MTTMTFQQLQDIAMALHIEKQARQEAEKKLETLIEAVSFALKGLGAPDCPSIPDGAMIRGRLFLALEKAGR